MDGSAASNTAQGAAAGSAGGPWGAIAGGAIGLAGGMMGNAASAREADKARKFAFDVMRTGHQVEMRDLAQAGLNPILTATGGSGARASSANQATQDNPAKDVVSGAAIGNRMQAELGLITAQTEKAKAEARNTEADTLNKPGVGDVNYAQSRNLQMDTLLKSAGIESTKAQAAKFAQDIQESITREYTNLKVRAEHVARTENISLDNARQKALNEVLQKELPGLLDAAGLSSGAGGDAKRRSDMAADIAKQWADVFKGFIPGTSGPSSPPGGAYRLEPGPPAGGYPGPSSAGGVYHRSQPPRGTSNYLGR
ncbi:MAG: DNA pilot protein [Microvirus sp.]|nr:MAG: DNA pilot protein [Microvirus sp.]